jgi:hypothetical protein
MHRQSHTQGRRRHDTQGRMKEGEGGQCNASARTEGAEVEVLVAGDAADARLPPPVLVVPAFIQSVIVTCIARSHSVVVVSDLVTPRYMDAPREKPLLFLHTCTTMRHWQWQHS